MSNKPIQRALLSVSAKEGIVSFAQALHELGVELISTGGTCSLLRENNIPVFEVSEVTGFPEIMDGRVKTLHPKILGGILGKRVGHREVAQQHQINWIDLVVVNLYPFSETVNGPDCTFNKAIENIDVGGPTMIRAAAKNMEDVTVIVDPADYEFIISQMRINKGLQLAQRQALATKAFALTAQYDAVIHHFLINQIQNTEKSDHLFPEHQQLSSTKVTELRYGENPHQKACAYRLDNSAGDLLDTNQHQGKALSYNNLVDAHAAVACVREFKLPACVIVKHANPCGVALADTILDAFSKALAADSASAFGGVIAMNQICDAQTATKIADIFFEVVIATGFTPEALQILGNKPNLRVIDLPKASTTQNLTYKFVDGLVLVQETDHHELQREQLKVVTKRSPSPEEMDNLLFAWQVVKHVKSNAIVVAKNNQTQGIGPGQVSRVDSVEIAIKKAGSEVHQAGLASDAFFPFKDSIEQIAKANISAIIQPGGSIRDEEVIAACNEHGIAMIFTGVRSFNH